VFTLVNSNSELSRMPARQATENTLNNLNLAPVRDER